MKNTQLKIGVIAILAGLYSAGAVAETATGVANATVVEPLIINNLVAMDFSTIAAGTSGGAITMASGGGLSVTAGDADIVGVVGGTPLTFDITGEAGQACTLTVSDGVLSDGTNTMALATTNPACPALSGGADSVEVVGVLTLGASQPAGAYSTGTAGGTVISIVANYD